jgi:hypothetical protein
LFFISKRKKEKGSSIPLNVLYAIYGKVILIIFCFLKPRMDLDVPICKWGKYYN